MWSLVRWGAITWNVITWYYGIPSSSSHALIGGIVGAVIARRVPAHGHRQGYAQDCGFIFVSPLLGFTLGSLMMVMVAWLFRRTRPSSVDKWFAACSCFRRVPTAWAMAATMPKTIGIIWMLLIATGYTSATDSSPPTWTIHGACYAAIGLGTMFGGWRIVNHHGSEDHQAQARGRLLRRNRWGAMTLFLATMLGIRCPPRTPSPVPSSGWAPAAPAPCAGAWGATSSGPGSDDSRQRAWRAVVYWVSLQLLTL